ncbi:MAG: ferrochelatase [Candidatus Fischerbacteria bacterium RBG_13_37_8]|uniref:Ferrochelatase n=1 Tax=Candidatus Fischerbacteria bacterium RBG_13_37_8 TaxID=1817863 RepID=A0A1F5VTF6_9BACT|nr:MAG: ferrochelatase [Candidatus Fischerbacteria bacterium RBG_13_37_8]
MKNAIVLFNLGSPDKLESVEPFLINLFSDRDIIKLPFGKYLSTPLAKMIARIRKRTTRKFYESAGGVSPLMKYTQAQAQGLEQALPAEVGAKVFIAMRYWHPFLEECIDEIKKEEYQNIVLLPLYPHYSESTTGSFYNHFLRLAAEKKMNLSKVRFIKSYQANPHFIEAVMKKLLSALEQHNITDFNNTSILLSAHSIPKYLVEKKDLYVEHINETAELLKKAIHRTISPALRIELAFQSKMGPFKWLGPSVPDMIKKFAAAKIDTVIVVPVSFVADNIETVYELGMQVRDEAHAEGIKDYILVECVNDSPEYIQCLTGLVKECLVSFASSAM